METFKALLARLDHNGKKSLTYKTFLNPEEVLQCEPVGYGVPRTHPYLKHTTEAMVELAIQELNKIEGVVEKKLFHSTKGLLATLDHITSSESWVNHSYHVSDRGAVRKMLKKVMDFETELPVLASNDSRYQLVPMNYSVVEEKVIGTIEEPTDKNFHMVIAFPKTEDPRHLFAQVIRLMSEILTAITPKKTYTTDKYDYMNGQTDEEIHEELIYLLTRTGRTLSYLVNSSSWRDNQLHGFDLMELEMKARV